MNHGPLEHVPMGGEELSHRDDLVESIGIIFKRPRSGGETRELFNYLGTITSEIDEAFPSNAPLDRTVPAHPYEIPPAAGTWSEIAVLLWENGRPVLEAVGSIASTAQAIKWVLTRTVEWKRKKNNQIAQRLSEPGAPITPPEDEMSFFLTQGAISVLVLADLVERYGYLDSLSLQVSPRGIVGYNDPAHPNGTITYVISCKWPTGWLVYLVNASGKVLEHFKIESGQIHPLEIPDLLRIDEHFFGPAVNNNGLNVEPISIK